MMENGAGAAGGKPRTLPVIDQLVRVAFLVRLLALAAAVGGLIGSRLTPGMFIAVLLLSAMSFAALSQPMVLEQLMIHPLLAMADLLVVMWVFAWLGVDSPLSIAALSTALLLGLLYRLRVCLLLALVLIVSYLGAALSQDGGGDELGFFLLVGMPLTFACLVGIGQSTRRIAAAQNHAERRLLAVAQIEAAADERSRLARELHDTLAKALQGMAFAATTLPTWIDRDPERAKAEARALARDAGETVGRARSLLTQMRLDAPSEPFARVLTDLIDSWSQRSGHPVELHLAAEVEPGTQARYELLACVREALENVSRHAPGAGVRVTMSFSGGALLLQMDDDGPGFDPAVLPARERAGHFGVRGMAERLRLLGGTGVVESRPGAGVQVRLSLPLRGSEPSPSAGRPRGRAAMPHRSVSVLDLIGQMETRA